MTRDAKFPKPRLLPLAHCLLAVVFFGLALPSLASARPRVVIETPKPGAVVRGHAPFTAAATRGAKRVVFYVGGRRVFTDSRRPWRASSSSVISQRRFGTGRRRLGVVAIYPRGVSAKSARTAVVRPASAGDSDRSAPSLSWRAPTAERRVSGVLRGTACEAISRDNRTVQRVRFSVDGRALNDEYKAPYNCEFDTRRVADGRHRLVARAYDTAGNTTVRFLHVVVDNDSDKEPPTGSGDGSAEPSWASGFGGGDFTEWSWWGQGDSRYTGLSVVNPAAADIPERNGKAARFAVTPDDAADGRIHSKVYKDFHLGSGSRTNWRKPDPSGSYRAWYYVPRDYSVKSGKWLNVMQFKDQYWHGAAGGSEQSDPTWWVEFGRASDYGADASRSDAPVAVAKHWKDWDIHSEGVHPGERVEVPLGRWFEIRAEVYRGDRIAFYADDKLLTVGRQADYPVGQFHQGSFNWIYGIGHYGTNPGRFYADNASFAPR